MRVNHFRQLLALVLAVTSTAFASTTWYVNGVTGSDSDNCMSPTTACKTIGHAISLTASGDTVEVSATTYQENLTIAHSLTITGAGASTTIIDGGGVNTVITIPNTTSHVAVSNLTIQNGSANIGAGIFNAGTMSINSTTISANAVHLGSSPRGGGVENGGTLTISNSTLTGNTAVGLESGAGGGIDNGGTLTISNSTLTGNTASGGDRLHSGYGYGGGINNGGTLTISNSTLTGNTATGSGNGYGGGIKNGGTLRISNSTLSGNAAPTGGGIADFLGSSATLQNSIIANSSSGGNCSGIMTSDGYNLSSDTTCDFGGPGDLNNTNPQLGPLQNNGGPTDTMAIPLDSPALDAGNPSGCTNNNGRLLKIDQRGYPRPGKYKHDRRCDMGAYESQTD